MVNYPAVIHMTKKHIVDIALVALFAALIAVCTWISVPLPAVSFTLQTFAVFTAVGLLGGKRGTLSVLVYILLGAIGLPVFSGFRGGIGALLGQTGGYIAGFLFTAVIIGLFRRFFGTKILPLAVGMVLGLLICYAFGTVWFIAVYTAANGPVGILSVLGWCVFPFIIPDLVKIAAALLVTNRLANTIP